MNTVQEPPRTALPRPAEAEPELRPAPSPDTFALPVGVLRFSLFLGTAFLTLYAYWSAQYIGPRGQALCGIFAILGLVALFSRNLAAVSWRPLFCGFGLQICLALFIMKFEINGMAWAGIADGTRPGYEFFRVIAEGLAMF